MTGDPEDDVSVLLKLIADVATTQAPSLPVAGESKRAQKRVRLLSNRNHVFHILPCFPLLYMPNQPCTLLYPNHHTPQPLRHMFRYTSPDLISRIMTNNIASVRTARKTREDQN